MNDLKIEENTYSQIIISFCLKRCKDLNTPWGPSALGNEKTA